MSRIEVGTVAKPEMLSGDWQTRQRLIQEVSDLGIDQIFMADHVSFRGGAGQDALINAATLAAMHPTIKICLGVYLLALRHPVPVARQLSSLSLSAPGRIIFGIGVGGEDRHEMEVCGIDPKTRGRRTNECLEIIRGLSSGESLDYSGEFFQLSDVKIKPAIKPAIPIVVGGRSDAAIRRAALYGEGWLGVWCSAKRFADATHEVEDIAKSNGRNNVPWRHGLQLWVGVHDNKDRARELVAKGMTDFYKMPFEAFEKYSPYGTPEEIADFLRPYAENGCQFFNLSPCAEDASSGVAAVAKVRELLRG